MQQILLHVLNFALIIAFLILPYIIIRSIFHAIIHAIKSIMTHNAELKYRYRKQEQNTVTDSQQKNLSEQMNASDN